MVYDRWGSRVYTSSNYQNTWGGDNLPTGIYVYMLQLKLNSGEFKIFKGTLSILR